MGENHGNIFANVTGDVRISHNNNVTINIVPFSHVRPEVTLAGLADLLKEGSLNAIMKLIKEEKFNPCKPEGMNCYVSNLKDKIGRIFEEGGWQVCGAEDLTRQVFETYCDCVDAVIENVLNNDGSIKLPKSLTRLAERWEKDNSKDRFVDHTLKQILLLLYNQRGLVKATHQL